MSTGPRLFRIDTGIVTRLKSIQNIPFPCQILDIRCFRCPMTIFFSTGGWKYFLLIDRIIVLLRHVIPAGDHGLCFGMEWPTTIGTTLEVYVTLQEAIGRLKMLLKSTNIRYGIHLPSMSSEVGTKSTAAMASDLVPLFSLCLHVTVVFRRFIWYVVTDPRQLPLLLHLVMMLLVIARTCGHEGGTWS